VFQELIYLLLFFILNITASVVILCKRCLLLSMHMWALGHQRFPARWEVQVMCFIFAGALVKLHSTCRVLTLCE